MTEFELIKMKLDEEAEKEEMTDHQKEIELEMRERAVYGRFWIWSGYFNEKNSQKWLDTAGALKHINPQVLEDIEDFILLKGFKGMQKEQIK